MKDEFDDLEEQLIEASIMNAGNFGKPLDMFHPDYGWIVLDGKPTEEGLLFYQEQLEPFEINNRQKGSS